MLKCSSSKFMKRTFVIIYYLQYGRKRHSNQFRSLSCFRPWNRRLWTCTVFCNACRTKWSNFIIQIPLALPYLSVWLQWASFPFAMRHWCLSWICWTLSLFMAYCSAHLIFQESLQNPSQNPFQLGAQCAMTTLFFWLKLIPCVTCYGKCKLTYGKCKLT